MKILFKIRNILYFIRQYGFAVTTKILVFRLAGARLYKLWFYRYHSPKQKDLVKQQGTIFEYMPKISIVMPVFNPDSTFLVEAIDSVINQTYSNWELCIADGNSNYDIVNILKQYVKKDVRIKVLFLKENYFIAENTNRAITLSTGDYIGLLDHDDLITGNCLFEFVKAINKNNKPDMLYSDEDKISKGLIKNPHFKPNYSLDLMRRHNHLCHFTLFKFKENEVYLKSEMNGAQDYDLYLRLSEKAYNIIHIPKILYHWRIHEKSTASNPGVKPYSHEAGRLALENHLDRLGLMGVVLDDRYPNRYRIKFLNK